MHIEDNLPIKGEVQQALECKILVFTLESYEKRNQINILTREVLNLNRMLLFFRFHIISKLYLQLKLKQEGIRKQNKLLNLIVGFQQKQKYRNKA